MDEIPGFHGHEGAVVAPAILLDGALPLRFAEAGAPGVALLDAGVVGILRRCQVDWCEVTVGSFTGWLERDTFYGLYPGEAVN